MPDEKEDVASYEGSLRIPNTHDVVDAVFEIGTETMRVTTGSEVLGSWPLTQVSVEDRGDTLLVSLGGESVLVEIPDRSGFSSALEPAQGRRSRAKKRRRPPKRPQAKTGPPTRSRRRTAPVDPVDPEPVEALDSPAAEPENKPTLRERVQVIASVFSTDNWREWLQDSTVRWSIATMGVVIFAMLALFATDTLGMILVLFGMFALIIAALAVSEDINAYRLIPSAISETGLVVGGAAAMVVGGLLILLS